MKKIFTLSVAVFLTVQVASSQSIELSPTVIASAGGYGEADNISISWTLGELAVTTLNQGDIILTQGFQQAGLGIVGFEDPSSVDWSIIAYPNPVRDYVNIQFELPGISDFTIETQDVAGRILRLQNYKDVVSGDVIPVGMEKYRSGIYFFRIYNPDRQQMRVISIRKQ